MAKLFTNHDPFHVHKIFGLLVLINFAYRLAVYFGRGYAFCSVANPSCSPREIHRDVQSVLVHAGLSWSSLLLPLPLKRNFNSPMLWREARWHSIIFASRAFLGTIASILGWWPERWAPNLAVKLVLVLGTCACADVATHYHGCPIKRTTNAMPYPNWVTPAIQQKVKLNYSVAQFGATLACIGQDPTLSFLSIYAIQGAAFLMTLRRKNLIATNTAHSVYQLSLCVMFLPQMVGLLHFPTRAEYWAFLLPIGLLTLLAGCLRLDLRCNKYVMWTICVGLLQAVTNLQTPREALLWLHTHPAGIAVVVFLHINDSQRTLRHYLPIWMGRPPAEKLELHDRQSLVRDLIEFDMLALLTSWVVSNDYYPKQRSKIV